MALSSVNDEVDIQLDLCKSADSILFLGLSGAL